MVEQKKWHDALRLFDLARRLGSTGTAVVQETAMAYEKVGEFRAARAKWSERLRQLDAGSEPEPMFRVQVLLCRARVLISWGEQIANDPSADRQAEARAHLDTAISELIGTRKAITDSEKEKPVACMNDTLLVEAKLHRAMIDARSRHLESARAQQDEVQSLLDGLDQHFRDPTAYERLKGLNAELSHLIDSSVTPSVAQSNS